MLDEFSMKSKWVKLLFHLGLLHRAKWSPPSVRMISKAKARYIRMNIIVNVTARTLMGADSQVSRRRQSCLYGLVCHSQKDAFVRVGGISHPAYQSLITPLNSFLHKR